MLARSNIALVAAAVLTAATWSLPAAANGERPGPAVGDKTVTVPMPKAKRVVRKRHAWTARLRQPVPRVVHTWFAPYPYERIAARWPILMLGIGF